VIHWSQISVKLILAIGTLGFVTCLSLLFSLFAFQSLHAGYDRLAQETLPQLSDSADVAQLSQAVATVAPVLAHTESPFERMTLGNELADLTREIDRQLDAIAARSRLTAATAAGMIPRIREERTRLTRTLETLDAAVKRRLALQEAVRQHVSTAQAAMADILTLRRRIEQRLLNAGDSSGGQPDTTQQTMPLKALQHWLDWLNNCDGALRDMVALQGVTPPARIRRVADRNHETWQALAANLAGLPRLASNATPTTDRQDQLYERLTQLFAAQTGLVPTLLALRSAERQITGLLNQNTFLANRFIGAIEDLHARLIQETEQQRRLFSRLSTRAQLILLLGCTLAVALAIGLALLIRRSVVTRLHALRDGLRDRVEGKTRPLPVTGPDEIAEIGRAAHYFIDRLEERERRLREAKNAAENLAVEAEAANRAKSLFLANISHELRTPLNTIIGFSDLITHPDTEPSDSRDYATDINASGRHLLALINNLLDLSRIDAGQRDLHVTRFDALIAIQRLEPLIRLQLQGRGQTLRIDQSLAVPILADDLAFRQIMLNLLSNAIKFGFEGTTIQVEGRQTTAEDGPRLQITVRDQGTGIGADEIERVLEPFYQEAQGYNRRNTGVGLGLSIVAALTRLHGGTTHITSEPNVGTAVTVCFAVAELEPAPTP